MKLDFGDVLWDIHDLKSLSSLYNLQTLELEDVEFVSEAEFKSPRMKRALENIKNLECDKLDLEECEIKSQSINNNDIIISKLEHLKIVTKHKIPSKQIISIFSAISRHNSDLRSLKIFASQETCYDEIPLELFLDVVKNLESFGLGTSINTDFF